MTESRHPDGLPVDVADFLQACKSLLKFHPHVCAWIDREGHMTKLDELGLTFVEADRIIVEELAIEHHVRGPEPDDHAPQTGIVNLFRYQIPDGSDAYVKIGLRLAKGKNGQLRLVIWSFKKWQDSTGGGPPQ